MNISSRIRFCDFVLVLFVLGLGASQVAAVAPQVPAKGATQLSAQTIFAETTLPKGPSLRVTAQQALQSAVGSATGDTEELLSNDEVSRGPSAKVYPKVAPATVLVHCGDSHGTGWIYKKSGWIVTNQHVVSDPLIELSTGYQMAHIYLGHLEEGIMTLDDEPLVAYVYRVDMEIDLALLKLAKVPEKKELPVIKLADDRPLPGMDCVVVGHPTRGTLWTVRSGEVAGIGVWPQDAIDVIAQRVSLSGDAKKQYSESLKSAPQRKMIVSSCGINPGDSGGPLLNEEGELIGVTQSIPKGGTDQGISYDKFSYHIHLDEVKKFLAKTSSSKPLLHVPSSLPPARTSRFGDRDGNDKTDTWFFSMDDESITGFWLDIDENSDPQFVDDVVEGHETNLEFDYEFGFRLDGVPRAFYDTDGDGQLDLILADVNRNGLSDLSLAFKEGQWRRIELNGQSLVDPELFQNTEIAKRFFELLELGAQSEEATEDDATKEDAVKQESATPAIEDGK